MELRFSLVSLYGSYLRRTFLSAGLQPRTISIDGGVTTLRYWTSTASPTSARTVVLLHGFGPEATWQWSHQVKQFSHHFHLVIPDLVFFGGSTTNSPERSEVFQAECVVKLLDGVGARRFSVVGTSYGGFVAYHVARMLGQRRVEKVVLASSDLMKREGDNDGLLEKAGVEEIEDLMLPTTAETMRKLMGLVFRKPRPRLPTFLLRDIIKTLYSENRENKVQLIKEITLDRSDALEKLFQEVLIVWGDQDKIFPLEKAFMVKKHVGEKVTLEVMENAGHLPQVEDPRRFNRVVMDFLLADDKSST